MKKRWGGLLSCLLLVGCQSQPSDVDYTNGMALESAVFAQLIQDDSYMLIDIRNEWEMEEGGVISGIDDHKNVYDPEHVNYLENLDKHDKYLFYCAHGVRSSFLTEHLLGLGFEAVYDLAGGVAGWEEAGLDFIAWEE